MRRSTPDHASPIAWAPHLDHPTYFPLDLLEPVMAIAAPTATTADPVVTARALAHEVLRSLESDATALRFAEDLFGPTPATNRAMSSIRAGHAAIERALGLSHSPIGGPR